MIKMLAKEQGLFITDTAVPFILDSLSLEGSKTYEFLDMQMLLRFLPGKLCQRL